MSDVHDGGGWWLASDGRWYPPKLAAPAPAPPPPRGSLPPLVMPPAPARTLPPGASGTAGTPPGPWGTVAPPSPGASPAYPVPTGPNAYGPPSPGWAQVEPTTCAMAVWALVLVIVLGGVGALVGLPLAFAARAKIRNSGGALKGAGLALAAQIIGFIGIGLLALAVAIPTFLGVTRSGPPVGNLDYSVLGQITGTAPDEFDVPDVTNVSCEPPDHWTTGSTFTCLAYGHDGSELDQYFGTVAPNASDGTYQWEGRYVPSA